VKAITVIKFLLGAAVGGGVAYALTGPAPPAPTQRDSVGDTIPFAAARVIDEGSDEVASQALATSNATAQGPRLDALAARARTTPEDAFAEAMALTSMRLRELAVARIAREWAAVDPAAAFAALERISEETPREAFARELFSTLAKNDPRAAIAQLLEAEVDDTLMAMDAVDELARHDPDAIKAAIDKTTDARVRDFLQIGLIGAIAEQDPLAAAALAASLPQARVQQLNNEIGRRFAARDPEGAIAWATSVATGTNALLSTIVRAIAREDLSRAADIALRRQI